MNDEELTKKIAGMSPVNQERFDEIDFADVSLEMRESIMSTPRQSAETETENVVDIDHGRVTSRKRTRTVRSVIAASVAAVVAATAFVVVGQSSSSPVWAEEAVKTAESSPRLLISKPGWKVHRADQFSSELGELTFTNGKQAIDLKWTPSRTNGSLVESAKIGSIARQSIQVDGATASVFEYVDDNGKGNGYYQVLWAEGDDELEARIGYITGSRDYNEYPLNEQQFTELVSSLRHVSVDKWLSAMPASVVKPDGRAIAVQEMLQGVPTPPGFDSKALENGPISDRYQLSAKVSSAVACGWIKQWVEAKQSGDHVGKQKAAEALATSHNWKVLNDMKAEGDYPKVLTEIADAVNGSGTTDGGMKNMPIENTYKDALGCS